MSGLVLWGRVQRTKEFNGQGGRKVRSILLSVVLSAVLFFTLFLLLLSATPLAQAQGGYSPWRTFNTWNSGLLGNYVQAILQDSEGNLWFGTWGGGVSRYDGVSWQIFSEHSGLADNDVWAILQDSEGDLWFGTCEGGVSRYDGANWQTFTTENSGLADNDVQAILQDSEGNLWFGTYRGVSRYDGASWQTFTTENSGLAANSVRAILQDSEGDLWFGTYRGVSRYDGASWQTFTAENSGLTRNDVRAILQDSEGDLWFGTYWGVSRYDGVSWQTFTAENSGLAHNHVQAILQDSEGNLWFGTYGGVNRYDGVSWQSFTTENSGLAHNDVQAILQDSEGNLWFGASGGGVSRYEEVSWQTFTTWNSDLAHNNVQAILQDREGNLWFGTDGGGVSRYDGVSWQSFTTGNSGLADKYVRAVLQDSEGNLWFGTDGGVSRYDGVSWQTFTTENSGLSDDDVRAILQDSEGNLWFGTYEGGVSRYDRASWKTFTAENSGLLDNYVWAILQDSEGNLWFGTWGGGVSRYDGVSWQTFTTENSGLAANSVHAILQDSEGDLWFGTRGVSRYDGVSWQTFTTENSGLADNGVWAILQTSEGDLWFGTSRGVSRYDGVSWQSFTTENSGLAHNDVSAVLQDSKGDLWFGTLGGVSHYIAGTVPPVIVHLELITSGGQVYTPTGQLTLPYSQRDITFEFAGRDLKTDRKDLRYVYKLEGHDPDWHTTEPFKETARYFDLPSGTYTFVVQARDMDFNYSEPVSLGITIEPLPPTPTPIVVEPAVIVPFLGSVPLRVLYGGGAVGLLLIVLSYIGVSQLHASRRTRQAIERRDNPYVANVPVSDPRMFFGRQEILNQIVNGIHLNNFAVCGPKRIGKTSLLHRLAAELRQMDDALCSFFPVLLSLHGIPENRLFRTLMSAIVREYRSQTAPLALRCRAEGESYDTYNFLDDLDAVQETLQQSVNKPLRLVLLIDEGDTLNEYSQAILAQLRFVFMGPSLNYLKMVWSGEDLDRRKWKLRGSDWLTVFGHVFHLTPFTEEEATRLIIEPVPYYRYDKQAVRLILDHSQLIPHRIQLLCRGAVEEMLKARRGRITVEDVEASIRHLAGETAPPGVQPLATPALAADLREQSVRRLAEGSAEYHTDMESEEAE